jgi:glucosamine--fructose-6-phosphate aminotransferase (isomerizing)
LRDDLHVRGYAVTSQTDSEVIALLAQSFIDQGLAPRDAAEQAIARLDGAFALCFLFEGQDDLLICARRGSPLAIGHGEGEVFVGSDAIALAPLTRRITYLQEGDWAVLSRDSVEIRDARGQRANRPVRSIRIDAGAIDKAGHRHFMMKEIAEQPQAIARALARYGATDDTLPGDILDFNDFDRIVMVGCGTAFYACLTARYWFEGLARLPVEVDVASEFRYRQPPVPPRTLAIFVSQSGETADTLAALRYMAGKARIAAVVNVVESSIARESDLVLPIHAGPEIGVASTKAFTCQLTVLLALALKAAAGRGLLPPGGLARRLAELRSLPGLASQALTGAEAVKAIARQVAQARDVLFLGRGTMYPLALEAALKLKEISYIHAEGHAAGELKHGPIALVSETMPVIVVAPSDELMEKTLSNMQEVAARGGRIILITDEEGARTVGEGIADIVVLPRVASFIAPIVSTIPVQLLAYHTAVLMGTDVDQPRNLAKSVTVE